MLGTAGLLCGQASPSIPRDSVPRDSGHSPAGAGEGTPGCMHRHFHL